MGWLLTLHLKLCQNRVCWEFSTSNSCFRPRKNKKINLKQYITDTFKSSLVLPNSSQSVCYKELSVLTVKISKIYQESWSSGWTVCHTHTKPSLCSGVITQHNLAICDQENKRAMTSLIQLHTNDQERQALSMMLTCRRHRNKDRNKSGQWWGYKKKKHHILEMAGNPVRKIRTQTLSQKQKVKGVALEIWGRL